MLRVSHGHNQARASPGPYLEALRRNSPPGSSQAWDCPSVRLLERKPTGRGTYTAATRTVLEPEKPPGKVPADLVSVRTRCWLMAGRPSLCPHVAEGAGQLSGVSFPRTSPVHEGSAS